MLLLVLVFVVLPIAELYVIAQTSHAIGFGSTLLLLLSISVLGVWLVRHQGLRIWSRFQQQLASGVVPSRELADGVLVLFAGVLLLTPGFITDVLGILLLLPPVRAGVRALFLRRTRRRATLIAATYDRRRGGPRIIDVGSGDVGSGDVGPGDVGSGDIGLGDVGPGAERP